MAKQKTIGILGGMSSAATGEYYALINHFVKQRLGGYHTARMLINSVDFADIERFVRGGKWPEAGVYLADRARELEAAGADCVFLATNTMHRVREQIKDAISIPFVDIFETVAQEIRRQGKSRMGILGTYPVMSQAFYQDAFREEGIELIAPGEEDMLMVDQIVFDELTDHQFLPSSKTFFVNTMRSLADRGAEGVILGCTEINMLVAQEDIPEVPLFDTTALHCNLAARIAVGEVDYPAYQTALRFGKYLDRDDFRAVATLLAPNCKYEIGGKTLHGPEKIVASYEENMVEGKAKFDELVWGKCRIEMVSPTEYDVYFSDQITHQGITHQYSCKQQLVVNNAQAITHITHQELPGQREKLTAFLKQVGVQ
jgi:aspartate racemase